MMMKRWFIDGLWVLSPYSPSSLMARLIKSLKYRSMEALAEILGEALADRFPLDAFETYAGLRCGGTMLVPVPLHPRRERARGYNQARLLAQALGTRHGLELEEMVIRSRYTAPQAKQPSREARLTNLIGAFSLNPEIDDLPHLLNKKFILIDDVCSTGATLNESSRVLKQAGAKTVWGVVLARG